jgi:hypothetical protein
MPRIETERRVRNPSTVVDIAERAASRRNAEGAFEFSPEDLVTITDAEERAKALM